MKFGLRPLIAIGLIAAIALPLSAFLAPALLERFADPRPQTIGPGPQTQPKQPVTPQPPVMSKRPVFDTRPLAEVLTEKRLKPGMPVFVRIIKESSELEVWMQRGAEWVLAKAYPVCKWSGALGPKLKEGDGQSPEGFYRVTHRALNPNSSYHLSFNLGFPNAYDRAHGRTGSFLMVHGDCLSIGCYAMTDAGIEEIYSLVAKALRSGQTSVAVHIFPFRMTEGNMARHAASPWIGYWRNLKQGWDLFEARREPPDVRACGKNYRFDEAPHAANCTRIAGL